MSLLGTSSAPHSESLHRVAGACHGFVVQSEIPLRLVRDALSVERADFMSIVRADEDVAPEPVARPLATWVSSREKPFSARLHAALDGFAMWIDGLGVYGVDTARQTITVPADVSPAVVESRLWGLPSVLCFLARGDLSLHAAAVEIDGRAVLLTAPGRRGKTTLAAAFHRAGFRVLSEDLCRIRTDPAPSVFPAAAMLRLRHDVRDGLGSLPSTEVVLQDDDRLHLAVTGPRRGGGGPVPLAAVVTLDAGPGAIVLDRVETPRAIRDLWGVSFNLPTDSDRERCFTGVSAVAAAVPVWSLTRPLTLESLPAVIDRIATTCLP